MCPDSDSFPFTLRSGQLDLGLRPLGALTPCVRLAEYCRDRPGLDEMNGWQDSVYDLLLSWPTPADSYTF